MPGERPEERDESVLESADIDITDSEYVVSTDDSPPDPQRSPPKGSSDSSLDPRKATRARIEVSVGGQVAGYHTHSEDVVAVFSELVRWYATRIDADLGSR